VSSILKALKQLENDPTKVRAFEPWHQEVDVKKAFGGEARGLRRRSGVFYVFLAAPFLLFGGWLLLKYGIALTRDFSPAKLVTPPIKAMAKKVPAEMNKLPGKAKLKPLPKRTKTSPVSTPKTRVAATKPLIASGTNFPISKKDETPNPLPAKARSFMKAREPAYAESPSEIDFNVQAIAWSNTPEKRIAVINGRIVHEGEHVDGVLVTQIGLDDVFFKKGSKKWKLKCGGQR